MSTDVSYRKRGIIYVAGESLIYYLCSLSSVRLFGIWLPGVSQEVVLQATT